MRAALGIVLVLLFALSTAAAQTYSTTFPLTEKPIAEQGRWTNGKAVGLDWADVSTTPGLAIGLESGSTGYDDATALLTGTWGADQAAQATVFTVNQNDSDFEEVELRLRSSLAPHSNTGYEINFRCSKTANAYMEIVRWNGPLGDFAYLIQKKGAQYGVQNGDSVKATIVGNVITAYINDVEVARVTDSTYSTGNPGIGFFLSGTPGKNGEYGFTSFTASGSVGVPPAAPSRGQPPGEGQGCFLATAAYGSPLAPEVERLRRIRDRFLLPSGVGRSFVTICHRLSPPLAGAMAHSSWLRALTRLALIPVVAWAGLVLWSPVLGVTVPLAALSLAGVSGVACRRRRRG